MDLVGSGKPMVDPTVGTDHAGVLGADSAGFQFQRDGQAGRPHSNELAPNIVQRRGLVQDHQQDRRRLINMGNTQTGDSSTYDPTINDPATPTGPSI